MSDDHNPEQGAEDQAIEHEARYQPCEYTPPTLASDRLPAYSALPEQDANLAVGELKDYLPAPEIIVPKTGKVSLHKDDCVAQKHPYPLVDSMGGIKRCSNCLVPTGNGAMTQDEAQRRMAGAWNLNSDLPAHQRDTTMPPDRGLEGVVDDLSVLTRRVALMVPLLPALTRHFELIGYAFESATNSLKEINAYVKSGENRG